ncbi:MAG: hypothetical protein AAF602_14845 [Myxococcota bacterium]
MTMRTLPLLAGLITACSEAPDDGAELEPEPIALAFDVSEDASRFLFDGAPLHPDGMPHGGNEFVTSGYLYPRGFLAEHEGTLDDGRPAYPDEVVGSWTCRGTFLGEGAYETGPALTTTQTYVLYDEPGFEPNKLSATTLVTEGFEMMVPDVHVTRAVTGGSGAHVGMKGEQRQVMTGLNAGQGVNLAVEIDLY